MRENEAVMHQMKNNTPEQAMLGDFPRALDDAIMASGEAHKEQMMQLLSDPNRGERFARVIFELLNGGK